MAGERPVRLREALAELAAADLEAVLEDARAQARERASALLADALTDALLDAVAARGPVAPAHPAPADGASALYVYGVVAAGTELGDLPPGVEADTEVRLLAEGKLAAVISEVARADFDEERLREHLGDLGWVEATARAHERVLEAVRAQATVVPMRMCSVYADATGLRELLRRETRALSDALAALAGKAEWGVKVFSLGPSVAAPEAELEAGARSGASGADYLQRRLHEREARAQAAQHVEEAVGDVHQRLGELATDALILPPQRPQASGREGEMVHNGVYLIGEPAQERFHEEVRALADEYGPLGLELETTGPWPAYNFVPGAIGANW